jgi:hypothetical protein
VPNIEGVVAKRWDGRYLPGQRDWVKASYSQFRTPTEGTYDLPRASRIAAQRQKPVNHSQNSQYILFSAPRSAPLASSKPAAAALRTTLDAPWHDPRNPFTLPAPN